MTQPDESTRGSGAPTPTAPSGAHTDASDARRVERWWRLGLLAFLCLLYLPGLGAFGLWDPWEVHYGEAGRQVLERRDWLSPWWGSHWHAPDAAAEGEYFFSKPILQLWAMALGVQFFGHTAFAIRLGTALLAILGVMSAYIAGERVWNRRVGLLFALVLATSPFYAMLSRQAQTDMPFVSLMAAALFFFMAALFGRDQAKEAPRAQWALLWTGAAVFTAWQLQIITIALLDYRQDLATYDALLRYGPIQALAYIAALGLLFHRWRTRGERNRQTLRLYLFYGLIALATLAKGLLGFLLPGAIILTFILVQRDWRLLQKVELWRGTAFTLIIGLPWYSGMLARHGGIGGEFWTRFIIHDHFRRLAAGVHQIDTGTFEHFLRWLGYGLFPWIGLLPIAMLEVFRYRAREAKPLIVNARIFLFLWALIAFALFTASSTKFHHYIFPAIPPLAALAALSIDDLLRGTVKLEFKPLLLTIAVGSALVIGLDLWLDPQNLKNLFTYRYDRLWDAAAWDWRFRQAILPAVLVGALGVALLFTPPAAKLRRAGLGALGASTLGFTLWLLHGYMPAITPSWSQQGLWDVYYSRCTPIPSPPNAHPLKRYCEEPVISYRLNWRGETFFTQNEIVPIRSDDEWAHFLEMNDGACFYAIMDNGRTRAFIDAVPAELQPSVRKLTTSLEYPELAAADPELHARFVRQVGKSNNKFDLLQIQCDEPLNAPPHTAHRSDEPQSTTGAPPHGPTP